MEFLQECRKAKVLDRFEEWRKFTKDIVDGERKRFVND